MARIDITTAGNGVPVILNDLLISGDIVVKSAITGRVLFDSRTDGGDISPDLAFCPVSWIYSTDGPITITIIPAWEQ